MGKSTFELFQENPDEFYGKINKGNDLNRELNHVANTAWNLAQEKVDEEQLEKIFLQTLGYEFLKQKPIWDEIKDKGISFSLDENYAKEQFPKTWEDLNKLRSPKTNG